MGDEKLYEAVPENTPYLRPERYALFKEDHKNIIRVLRDRVDIAVPLRLIDVGCANGELLYQLRRAFPHWHLEGVDFTADYIRAAQAFAGLEGVTFRVSSLFDVTGTWDVVLSTGLVEIFVDPTDVLRKLVALTRPGGLMVADGRFNELDLDVRLQFRDRSPASRSSAWRTDWNLHAQRTVREALDGQARSVVFAEVEMDADLPRDPAKPASHTWTFRDADGRNLQTNGARILKNKQLVIVER